MAIDDLKYFPLIPGLRLFYRGKAPGQEDSTSTFEVLQAKGTSPNIVATCRNNWRQGNERGSIELTIRSSSAGVFETPDRLELPFPLESGRSWNNGYHQCTVQSKTEFVIVPAGQFRNCLVITYLIAGGEAGWGKKIYAPGVGLIQEIHSDEASPWERLLASYDIQTTFYSCFISYSSKNEDFAERLYDDLQTNGVPCWFAPHDIRGGQKIHDQIDRAIRANERLLLILSSESMTSEWVKTEISKARKREVQEARQVLFPVRLVSFEELRKWELFDADTGKDSAREIREYFIPDFTNWKNGDAYDRAFDRLLRDLKATRTVDENKIIGALLRIREQTRFLWKEAVNHASDRSNFAAKITSSTLKKIDSELELLIQETGLRVAITPGSIDVASGESFYEITITKTTPEFWRLVDKVVQIELAS